MSSVSSEGNAQSSVTQATMSNINSASNDKSLVIQATSPKPNTSLSKVEKKLRRAKRFSIPLLLSEQEKCNLGLPLRFGTYRNHYHQMHQN